jgi:hypothetical protein
LKAYRRNAIVDRESEPPMWLVRAVEEAQRLYAEAPWWKRLYWHAAGLARRVANAAFRS